MANAHNPVAVVQIQVTEDVVQLAGVVCRGEPLIADRSIHVSTVATQASQYQPDGLLPRPLHRAQHVADETFLLSKRRISYAPGTPAAAKPV